MEKWQMRSKNLQNLGDDYQSVAKTNKTKGKSGEKNTLQKLTLSTN